MNAPGWDVIVAGGGMCGVAAAHELEQRLGPSARILLLEAADELGGRARTKRTPEGRAVDLGAHYFGVKHRRVRALAERVCPEDIFERSQVFGPDPASRGFFGGQYRVTPRSRTFFDVQGLEKDGPLLDRLSILQSMSLHLALEGLIVVEAPWRTPFARWFDRHTLQDFIEAQDIPRWIADMWGLGASGILSIAARDISFLYWLWYQASNGGLLVTANDYAGGAQEFSLRCGMGGLVQRLAAELRSTQVRCNAPVVHVDSQVSGQVTVRLADGTTETARALVVAAPPTAVRRHITFEPALHPKREHWFSQPVGHAAKAVLSYDEPFWHDFQGHHVMSWAGGPEAKGIEWGLDTSDPRGDWHSLMFFVAPTLFERLGPDVQDASVVERALIDAVVEITGDARAARPKRVDFAVWAREQWFGGGPNTVMGPGVLSGLEEVMGIAEGPEGRVHFASAEQSLEWTGYVEGALAGAERVADAVVTTLRARDGFRNALPARRAGSSRRLSRYLQVTLAATAYVALSPVVYVVRRWQKLARAKV